MITFMAPSVSIPPDRDIELASAALLNRSKEYLVNGLENTQQAAMWVWGVLIGDFNEDPSVDQIITNATISIGVTFTGVGVVAAWLLDLRDLIANCIKAYCEAKGSEGADISQINTTSTDIDFDRVSTWTWVSIVATLAGAIPIVGDILKGLFKIVFIFIKKALATGLRSIEDVLIHAIRYAEPHINDFLARIDIERYYLKYRWKSVYAELKNGLIALKAKLTRETLMGVLDQFIAEIKALFKRFTHRYSPWFEKANKVIFILEQIRAQVIKVSEYIFGDLNRCIDKIAEWCDRKLANKGVTKTSGVEDAIEPRALPLTAESINQHYIGRVSENSEAYQLLRQAKFITHEYKFPSIGRSENVFSEAKNLVNNNNGRVVANALNPEGKWPALDKDTIKTFHRMEADVIHGPAVLYRVVDEKSWVNGPFWVTEDVYKSYLTRDDWRRQSAVKADWNANGLYVTFTIPEGKCLLVYKGPAASQTFSSRFANEPEKEVDFYEGGGTQIVFYPTRDPIDTYISERMPTGWGTRDVITINDKLNSTVLVPLDIGDIQK